VLARATAGSTIRNTGETRLTLTNKQRISTAARQLAVLENPAVRAARVPENPAARAVRVALAVPESPVVPAVRVALAVLENPAVRAVQVALAALARQLAAALVRQLVVALVRQVRVVEKEAQTRSVVISHRRAAAVALSLAGVGALLKPRAAGVAAA
jgi:hypothetical protein